MTSKSAALYVRVSTASKTRQGDALTYHQNPEVQERPLRELLAQRGWQLHRVYATGLAGPKKDVPAWTP